MAPEAEAMPSIISHPAVPLALAAVLPPEMRSLSVVGLGIACSVVPDLDVVGFRFGVPYGHLIGHRGLSHSILFAACLSAALTWALPWGVQSMPWLTDKSEACPSRLLRSVYTLFGETVCQGGSPWRARLVCMIRW